MKPAATFVPIDSISALLPAGDYLVDAAQRCILFWDTLRQRGNQYLEHLAQGQPPVLVFDYETILDGRRLKRPVNYALVRIKDRRCRPRPDWAGGFFLMRATTSCRTRARCRRSRAHRMPPPMAHATRPARK